MRNAADLQEEARGGPPSLRASAGRNGLSAPEAVASGEHCVELGQPERARLFFEQALRQAPGHAEALNNLGFLAFRDGRFEEAEGFFHQALSSSGLPETRHNLAALYRAVPRLARPRPGAGAVCPCCGGHYPGFIAGGPRLRPRACCPCCGSLERHRLAWLYLRRNTDFFRARLRVLHIAPEGVFQRAFRALPNLKYVSADLSAPLAMVRMDLVSVPFAENTFDVILCNHVLEHIPDDRSAVKELVRVLRPAGWALVQVPVDMRREVTFEDPQVTDPAEREQLFGQGDHVRWYGRDFPRRLADAGFEVEVEPFFETLGSEEAERYGLRPGEDLYLCRKAASPSGDLDPPRRSGRSRPAGQGGAAGSKERVCPQEETGGETRPPAGPRQSGSAQSTRSSGSLLELGAEARDLRVASRAAGPGRETGKPARLGLEPLVPILVRGTGRSGTTALMEALSADERIVFPRQYPFESRFLAYWYRLSCVAGADRANGPDWHETSVANPDLNRIGPVPFPDGLGIDRTSLVQKLFLGAWEAFSSEIQRSRARNNGNGESRYYAEKTPEDVAAGVRAWMPVRELLLIRDPRDVFLSAASFNRKTGRLRFGQEQAPSPAAFATRVCRDMRPLLQDFLQVRSGEGPIGIRYEDLVLDRAAVLGRIYARLGLSMPQEGPGRVGRHLLQHATSRSPADSVERWRREMAPELREVFRAELADLLSGAGYDPI